MLPGILRTLLKVWILYATFLVVQFPLLYLLMTMYVLSGVMCKASFTGAWCNAARTSCLGDGVWHICGGHVREGSAHGRLAGSDNICEAGEPRSVVFQLSGAAIDRGVEPCREVCDGSSLAIDGGGQRLDDVTLETHVEDVDTLCGRQGGCAVQRGGVMEAWKVLVSDLGRGSAS
jgi:hypothetical protein